ncbi:hypothetical protein [Corallococcus macrosporus]|uniref:Uncharacterized protein n=1 Tax=Corallococcus macrosporus DSM 14697 TaxID=1189310 RepID=A0A250JNI4_9BACT|nr:hypothetical protein [Corallococcus macrosporus]ATB45429.1 hypothetical protein MYMAC_001014 [Corallococcus macrosporus DSM 14697]
MKTTYRRHVIVAAGAMSAIAVALLASEREPTPTVLAASDSGTDDTSSGDGLVPPPYPVFPRGNALLQPLAESSDDAQAFLDFYTKQLGVQLPRIKSSELVKLPNRNLDIAHNGLNLGSQSFSSSLVCQSCHDSDWKAQGSDLPEMAFWQQPTVNSLWADGGAGPMNLSANWSPFGDWSGSIKALAGRDPVFLAQVETTRSLSPHQPNQVDQLCLRCHSPLAERQALSNHVQFDHYTLYATPEGAPYENPFPDVSETQPRNAVYGALARDGLSCSVCHAMAPSEGQPWNGTDYSLFYGSDGALFGPTAISDRLVSQEEKRTQTPPSFPFTASMNLRPGAIVGPDVGLNAKPMAAAGLNLETAAHVDGHSYLRDSMVCGACHVVILPKVPSNYRPGMPITEANFGYERPASCDDSQTTFRTDGDFTKDPCVALAYEQTTYFEWLNSGYPGANTSCQSCHMPLTAPESPHDKRVHVAQRNDDLAPFYEGSPPVVAREYNRHTLLGINLFVHEMFQQFPDVLGLDFYLSPDSRVPPYLQSPDILNRTPNLVPNPGAEDGNTAGWSQQSAIAAVQTLTGAQGHPVRPSHGRYFFQLSEGTSTLRIDLTRYQDALQKGGDKTTLIWGATGWCDRLSCGELVVRTYKAQDALASTSPPLAATPGQSRWQPLQANMPVGADLRRLELGFTARSGETLLLDDLFLALRFPDGTIAPLTDARRNYVVAQNLLNAEQSILDLAYSTAQGSYDPTLPAVQLSLGDPSIEYDRLNVPVTLINNAGHKFPSGAGFRRAFIQFEVLDASGTVLWASGQPNAQGAICNGRCNANGDNILASEFSSDPSQLQPHFQTLQRQDQVQIYEVRVVDDLKRVTSLELQQFHDVKDNRILPAGWKPASLRQPGELQLGLDLYQLAQLTAPLSEVQSGQPSIESDPDYPSGNRAREAEGEDTLVYQVPLSEIPTWASVRVRLNYQSIPPGYLGARFKDALKDNNPPGPAMQRLIYMSSHLNTKTPMQAQTYGPSQPTEVMNNWSMVLGEARVTKR